MEVNVVDMVDYGMAGIWRQLNTLNQDPIRISSGPNGVDRMVTEIINKVKAQGSIDVLRIYSHGNSGAFVITGGDHDVDPTSLVADWNLDKMKSTLTRLTPYFKPAGRVEIYGCYVATHTNKDDSHSIKKGSEGEKLILELAKIWGVNVFASGNASQGLSIRSLKFEGLGVMANPGGGLTCAYPPPIGAGY